MTFFLCGWSSYDNDSFEESSIINESLESSLVDEDFGESSDTNILSDPIIKKPVNESYIKIPLPAQNLKDQIVKVD